MIAVAAAHLTHMNSWIKTKHISCLQYCPMRLGNAMNYCRYAQMYLYSAYICVHKYKYIYIYILIIISIIIIITLCTCTCTRIDILIARAQICMNLQTSC